MHTFRTAVVLMISLAGLAGISCQSSSEQQADSKPRIAGMVFQEDQFFRLVRFGMQQGAKDGNADLLEANSNEKPDKEIQLVNTYIARGVDAIVISPLSATASVAALKRAHQKGITIVTYNSTIEGNIPAAFIQSDQYDLGAQTGQEAVRYIKEQLDGTAKIATLAFSSNLPEQSAARTNGFKDQVTQLPGVEIVAEQDAWMAEKAVQKAGDLLTAHPEIDIIWAANEGGTVGAVMAVKNTAKAGEVTVFGTDISEQLLDFLVFEDNILQAVTGQQPFNIGYLAVESALKVIHGEPVESKVAMPGVLLTRRHPDRVRSFKQNLQELIARSAE